MQFRSLKVGDKFRFQYGFPFRTRDDIDGGNPSVKMHGNKYKSHSGGVFKTGSNVQVESVD